VALVWIPTPLDRLCGGRKTVSVGGSTVGEVIRRLENECPGISAALIENGELTSTLAPSVDGAIAQLGLLEPVGPDSELFFVPAISGG
jgi:molybdopterin synthase sulfur carrier subunit